MNKLVLFGTGKISDVLADYFERDSEYEIVAYTCEAAYVTGKEHRGRPLIAFEEVERQFAPASHAMHIAVGYQQMNRVRERVLNAARAKGYKLPSFISTRSWPGPSLACGDNCFVADGASVEPQARVGENVALWSNVLVGHHAEIADHAWLAGGASIGGSSKIGARCFLGMNATVGHEVTVGEDCLLGARSLVTKPLAPGSVVIDRDSEVIRLNSEQFLRFTKMK